MKYLMRNETKKKQTKKFRCKYMRNHSMNDFEIRTRSGYTLVMEIADTPIDSYFPFPPFFYLSLTLNHEYCENSVGLGRSDYRHLYWATSVRNIKRFHFNWNSFLVYRFTHYLNLFLLDNFMYYAHTHSLTLQTKR